MWICEPMCKPQHNWLRGRCLLAPTGLLFLLRGVHTCTCKNNSHFLILQLIPWVSSHLLFPWRLMCGGCESVCVASCVCPCVFAPMCVHQRGTLSRQCCCRWGWGAPWWAAVAERPALIKGARRGGRGGEGESSRPSRREERWSRAAEWGGLWRCSLRPWWDPPAPASQTLPH